jgi:processing peptidase subunit beta
VALWQLSVSRGPTLLQGTSSRSKAQLESEISALGGSFSACTERDVMSFQATVFKQDVPKAVAILSDIVQNSVFDEAAINAERSVILDEINGYSPQEVSAVCTRVCVPCRV